LEQPGQHKLADSSKRHRYCMRPGLVRKLVQVPDKRLALLLSRPEPEPVPGKLELVPGRLELALSRLEPDKQNKMQSMTVLARSNCKLEHWPSNCHWLHS